MNFDYSAATDFLAHFYEGTTHAVELRALGGETRAATISTRDPTVVESFCVKHDATSPERGIFFGVATRLNGSHGGKREHLAELPGLWVDIDCYKIGVSAETALEALAGAPMPPTVVIGSGGGLHAYWLFREPLAALAASPATHDHVKEDVDAALRQLAGIFAGDTAACDITRVLRLPGTHNTKTGELRPVSLLTADWARRYEFSDLQDMLDVQRPLLHAAASASSEVTTPAPDNPFTAYARNNGIGAPPIDIEARLAAMVHSADGAAGINATQRDVAASMVSRGHEDDEILTLILEATHRAAGPFSDKWNWKSEERKVRLLISEWRRKVAVAAVAAPPAEVRQISSGGSGPVGAVVSLADERATRRRGKGKAAPTDSSPAPLISRIGDAVIAGWTDIRGPIAVVGAEPYTYSGGVWEAWDKGRHHALKVAIQSVVAAGGIDPKTQLLNAVYRYILENPGLMREGISWDASGLVICQDGAIDPLTREVVSHSPEYWATTRAEVALADIGQGCPQWLDFLSSCFSDLSSSDRTAVIATVAEWFGASLVRIKPREMRKALWLYGESRTGKTRIAEVLRLLIGEPTCSLKLRALEKNFGGSALIGKRAWIADDAIGSSDEVDDALFKVIVTGEAFSTDVKNSAHETLRLNIPVLFTSNPLPRVKDQSDAVFNRSLLIHMRVVRDEIETAGAEPIDELIRREELAGVFSWALDGWARLFARGRFDPPKPMNEASADFKSANNVVGSWSSESISLSTEHMIDRRDAYASFKGWFAAEFGENAKVPSPKFMLSTLRVCTTLGPDHKSSGNRYITGVKLTEEGLTYRRDSAREAGITPGSGCAQNEVNKARPFQEAAPEARPTGKEPRF